MEPEVEIHPLGVTPGVVPVLPQVQPSCESCEMALHIGVFFDGAGNNKDWDDADTCSVGQGTQAFRRKESNVARLFSAYPDRPDNGYFRLYVSGVGTTFRLIGEDEPAFSCKEQTRWQ